MTVLDADHTATASDAFHDAPDCPACGASSERQRIVLTVPDGAYELTVLECRTCGRDHPVWS